MTARGRRPLIAGNWKLHNTIAESVALCRTLRNELAGALDAEVVVAPVFTAIAAARDALDGSRIEVAAQDCHWEAKGAFTGAVSVALLRDAGAKWIIVGHSERRQLFGETDEGVRKKTAAVLAGGVTPIVCVGETLAERERGKTLEVVLGQLDGALSGLAPEAVGKLVVAYEPVWAIGTGRNASPGDAEEVHRAIRGRVAASAGQTVADGLRILYGGSVKPDNARALLAEPDIDGALVGGASLAADSFVAIVRAVR